MYTNEELLYGIGNSAKYSVITLMRKEFEKRIDTRVCIRESLCCTPETITTVLNKHAPINNF